VEKNQAPWKSVKHVGYFIKDIIAFILIDCQFFLKEEILQSIYLKNQDPYSVLNF
jgi:hypothetical protein